MLRHLFDGRQAEKSKGTVCVTEKCPGLTDQSFKRECDINVIVPRWNKTGLLPSMIQSNPSYGDFSNVPSYQGALNLVFRAQEQFDALPSDVRSRFDNDPSKFLAFASDPNNASGMVDMGLAKPVVKPEAPVKAPGAAAPVGEPPKPSSKA